MQYRKPISNSHSQKLFTRGGMNIDSMNYRPIPRGGLRL